MDGQAASSLMESGAGAATGADGPAAGDNGARDTAAEGCTATGAGCGTDGAGWLRR